MADLIRAVSETGATLAFDATGGGKLAGQILTAMGSMLGPWGTLGGAVLGGVFGG